MTYNVFGGTLNPTLLLDQYQIILLGKTDTERVCVCVCMWTTCKKLLYESGIARNPTCDLSINR